MTWNNKKTFISAKWKTNLSLWLPPSHKKKNDTTSRDETYLFPESRVAHFRCTTSQITEAKFFTAFCIDITRYHLHNGLSVLKLLEKKKGKRRGNIVREKTKKRTRFRGNNLKFQYVKFCDSREIHRTNSKMQYFTNCVWYENTYIRNTIYNNINIVIFNNITLYEHQYILLYYICTYIKHNKVT